MGPIVRTGAAMAVKAPVALSSRKAAVAFAKAEVTYNTVSFAASCMSKGTSDEANGLPGTGVNVPSCALTASTEMFVTPVVPLIEPVFPSTR